MKIAIYLVWPGLGWSLLTGGRCSEMVINAGLTVPIIKKHTKLKMFKISKKCFIFTYSMENF
jgi:hypothetical protein